ncbi:uncharacterized protein ARMOST_18369 [Armillaria ostoyae]|uniref:Uncharacterized protein n=1 Tax=Armillaria ostoyae TaxID=47428 RepID=A0A284S1L4_ARMOS|nr:uncharacterized protein ARMOST_18369 [Armillaria ostoyae]
MGDSDLVYSHRIPLVDFCSNLIGARAYTASYFETRLLHQAPVEEIYEALEKAHPYLEAHMDTLREFNLFDCRYGLALRSQIKRLVSRIHEEERPIAWKRWELKDPEYLRDTYALNETLCLPGDEEYETHGEHCVPECELKPFRRQTLPPPRRPQATPSPAKPSTEDTSPAAKKAPRPTMIRTPQPPKEPSFTSPAKKKVAVVLPLRSSGPSAPNTCKRQHEQEALNTPPTAETSEKAKPTKSTTGPKARSARPSAPKAAALKSALKKQTPAPSNVKRVVKKPALPENPSSDSEAEPKSDEEDGAVSVEAVALDEQGIESDEIEVPPVKRPRLALASAASSPPPRAYHPLTGEPLTGLLYVPLTAPSDPAPPLPPAGPSTKVKGKQKAAPPASPSPVPASQRSRPSRGRKPSPRSSKGRRKATCSPGPSSSNIADTVAGNHTSLEADNVDNTIYARAFHPQIDLQFHEPPSRQALEYMKLSMLPSAPDSLTKPVSQIRNGREYMYRCHSDIDPHFIRPPLLTWPCYNCTLAGFPNECVFEGEVGEEICTKCKANRHGPCSARWDANQLRLAATLLDPLTMSSDGAICRGVERVERINAKIALLGRAMHLLREDREKIIGELSDGLEAISSREHGTEIIDAYAQVNDFLKSFVVRLGEGYEGSEADDGASSSGAV